ncbi:MAG: sugar phosphate isomerase/epimerase [Clostridia bacterium]|nr:sugar phosphate isomerase/epimerase [Clostridia bacterium]
MILSGVVSVTFRHLTADEIIALAVRANLQSIEWGGDIHVPHGAIKTAEAVGSATRKAGLKVASYGSYYKVGTNDNIETSFIKVLQTASALEAPNIRVWAGNRPSGATDESVWQSMIEETRFIADLAGEQNIRVSFEYHANTLTDSSESAARLLHEIGHPNVFCYWQPPIHLDEQERLISLQAITPWISNVHVFHWRETGQFALAQGELEWMPYMDEITRLNGDRYALLEFVKNDSVDQFLEDAADLKRIVAHAAQKAK